MTYTNNTSIQLENIPLTFNVAHTGACDIITISRENKSLRLPYWLNGNNDGLISQVEDVIITLLPNYGLHKELAGEFYQVWKKDLEEYQCKRPEVELLQAEQWEAERKAHKETLEAKKEAERKSEIEKNRQEHQKWLIEHNCDYGEYFESHGFEFFVTDNEIEIMGLRTIQYKDTTEARRRVKKVLKEALTEKGGIFQCQYQLNKELNAALYWLFDYRIHNQYRMKNCVHPFLEEVSISDSVEFRVFEDDKEHERIRVNKINVKSPRGFDELGEISLSKDAPLTKIEVQNKIAELLKTVGVTDIYVERFANEFFKNNDSERNDCKLMYMIE